MDKIRGIKIRDFIGYFARILGLATVMGFLFLTVAIGIFYMFQGGFHLVNEILPYSAVVGAVAFVAGTAFFDYNGSDYKRSLMAGGISAIIVSFILLSVVEGILFYLKNNLNTEVFATLLFSFSFSVIASTVILWLFKSRFYSKE
ncbi:MAG: putative membrane protein [Candidatus Methanohalarchaeum thermophilum]|uniref:Membrane protein n=1 Tax=Methanohalarchaeum thermophilum TaxID=1903181 RepID=A0A1Q6DXJ1_METT1|nr:MAG: putative membrane protein [Candidatus Methanohalarchaeum thermophilum]